MRSTDRQLGHLLRYGIEALLGVGIEEAEVEAQLLLGACCGLSRTQLLLYGDRELDHHNCLRYQGYIARRTQREPVAYILGEREFWSLPFYVSPAVLIPRPETEFLLDRVLALTDVQNLRRGEILDICCGSGIIATILARELGQRVFACDISFAALQVASANLKRHGVEQRVALLQMDLVTALSPTGMFSLVVSNPPYIRSDEVKESLAVDVRQFEPHLALDGGHDGLALIRRLHRQLPAILCDGGQVFLEIGADQGELAAAVFSGRDDDAKGRFVDVRVIRDYAGRNRVLTARYLLAEIRE